MYYICFKSVLIIYSSQTEEGSTGSGSSSGGGGNGGGHSSMKSNTRQRSPGAMARSGDTSDEPNTNPSNVETEDFISNIHPPTDDEGVRK